MTEAGEVLAFAPGSIGNVAVGFDVFGLAFEGPGDRVLARFAPEPGVKVARITGDEGRLPASVDRNAAAAAAKALLDLIGDDHGVELELHKGIPLASGLGGSAASSVAAAMAVDMLLGTKTPKEVLLSAALEGERVTSGVRYPDNAAAALYGGFVLVRSIDPIDVVEVPVPDELSLALVRPHLEVETGPTRKLLGGTVPLSTAVQQWGNASALIAGLFQEDWNLISRSLVDGVSEPVRSQAIPHFAEVKSAALTAGALGCSVSGSGPSMFAFCKGLRSAAVVGEVMQQVFRDRAGLSTDLILSHAGGEGARSVPIPGKRE